MLTLRDRLRGFLMLVVGIDPSATGAIVCVDSHGTFAVEDF